MINPAFPAVVNMIPICWRLTAIKTQLPAIMAPDTALKMRKLVYFAVCVVMIFAVLLFDTVQNKSLLDTIYTIVGYTYGSLLGLFVFGLFTKFQVKDKIIPLLATLSPILTFGISYFCKIKFNYIFGYEILIINGLLMFLMILFSHNFKIFKININK